MSPKFSSLKQLTFIVSQFLGSEYGLAGSLELRVSREAAVKLVAGAAFISRPDSEICFQAHACGCWQAPGPRDYWSRTPVLCHEWASPLDGLHHGSWLPSEREQK